jgi:hypothetical protein
MSTMNSRSPLAILGAVLLASSLDLAGSAKAADGQPMTQMQAAAADEQVVLEDVSERRSTPLADTGATR